MSTDRAVDARPVQEVIAEAMQAAFDEFVTDTGCFPDCFEWRGANGVLSAHFDRGNFASMVAAALAEAGYVVVPTRFIDEVVLALRAATAIGMRSCRMGDGLDYGNHDRLLREAGAWSAYVPVAVDDRYPDG